MQRTRERDLFDQQFRVILGTKSDRLQLPLALGITLRIDNIRGTFTQPRHCSNHSVHDTLSMGTGSLTKSLSNFSRKPSVKPHSYTHHQHLRQPLPPRKWQEAAPSKLPIASQSKTFAAGLEMSVRSPWASQRAQILVLH